jgi:hypothetical protein
MLMCVCLRILASSRIPRYDLGRQTPDFWGGSVTPAAITPSRRLGSPPRPYKKRTGALHSSSHSFPSAVSLLHAYCSPLTSLTPLCSSPPKRTKFQAHTAHYLPRWVSPPSSPHLCVAAVRNGILGRPHGPTPVRCTASAAMTRW